MNLSQGTNANSKTKLDIIATQFAANYVSPPKASKFLLKLNALEPI